jgi:crossover junction endodeoxyribonuclease RusA
VAREEAFYVALQAIRTHGKPKGEAYHISVTAHPPDARKRDADNIVSSLKHARDGIADAMEVDDRLFLPGKFFWGEQVLNGQIEINVEAVK